jgi:hypothetical protein
MDENVLHELGEVRSRIETEASAVLPGQLDFVATVFDQDLYLFDDGFGGVAMQAALDQVRTAEGACVKASFFDVDDSRERGFAKCCLVRAFATFAGDFGCNVFQVREFYFVKNGGGFFSEVCRCASGNLDPCFGKRLVRFFQELDGACVPFDRAYIQVYGLGDFVCREVEYGAESLGEQSRYPLAVSEIGGASLADDGNEGRLHFSARSAPA